MKTITAVTCGNIDTASSRLRSFYLFNHALEDGFIVKRSEELSDIISADIFHLQKKFGYKLFFASVMRRLMGKVVIFDFDDQKSGFKGTVLMLLYILVANIITTDTEGRRKYWNRYLKFKRFHVVPDVIDISSEFKFISNFENIHDRSYKLVWTGNANNIKSIEPLLTMLHKKTKFKITMVVDSKSAMEISAQYPWVAVVTWRKDIIFDSQFRNSFMILNHAIDQEAVLKSDNKMVLAIAAGVVPIVSRTPAYHALATALDAEKLVFDSFEDIEKIISNINHHWVQKFLSRSQQYIENHYSSINVYNNFKQKILGSSFN